MSYKHPVIIMYKFVFTFLYIFGSLNAQDFFSPGVTYKFQGIPYALQSSDIDGDGNEDIIVGGKNETGQQGILSIYWGKGDGTFKDKTDVLTDKYPVYIESYDFDKDGRKDIICSNNLSKTISIILSQPGNTFKPKDNLKLKESSNSFAIGDFNNDGIKDLAVICYTTKELILYKGSEKVSFKQIASQTLDFFPYKIKAGNYNGQGSDQIIIIQEGSSPVLLFAPKEINLNKWELKSVQFNMLTKPYFAELGDIDGDGFDDAVILNETGGMKIVFGEANGLFLDKEFPIETGGQALAFILKDFNNDKGIDLALLDPLNNQVIVMINQLTNTTLSQTIKASKAAIIYEKDSSKPNIADVGIISTFSRVGMYLYNGEGILVRKYFEFDSELPDGQFTLEWNGTDENENPVPDGNYIFYYKLGSIVVTRAVNK
jgi:hypothetical protein